MNNGSLKILREIKTARPKDGTQEAHYINLFNGLSQERQAEFISYMLRVQNSLERYSQMKGRRLYIGTLSILELLFRLGEFLIIKRQDGTYLDWLNFHYRQDLDSPLSPEQYRDIIGK